jgi:hypothetical protein
MLFAAVRESGYGMHDSDEPLTAGHVRSSG